MKMAWLVFLNKKKVRSEIKLNNFQKKSQTEKEANKKPGLSIEQVLLHLGWMTDALKNPRGYSAGTFVFMRE